MKKLLLASTTLVATAGVASAQDLGVAITGWAEMGIFDNGNDDAQFFTDIDVTFTMTGESDNGLSFGANIDLDEGGDGALSENPAFQSGESIFVSFAGATLTMGDTDGAIDARVPEMNLAGGSLADDETEHLGFDAGNEFFDGNRTFGAQSTNSDGQVARFDYTYSAFTFSLSAEQENNGSDISDDPATPLVDESNDSDTIYGVGVSYAAEYSGVSINTGLGYQTQDDYGNLTSVAATAGFASGLSVGATYSTFDWDAGGLEDTTHWGLGVGYEMNALAVGVNYGEFDDYAGIDGDTNKGWGLAASYDLGGGLRAQAGYGWSEAERAAGTTDSDTYSLGLRMDF
ncbi:porin [Roseivivax sp. CAU 1761]